MKNLLNVAQWVTDTMSVVQPALVILMSLSCLVIIVAILASPPQTGTGSNAITGASESFYTKNRGKNNQGRIRNIVIACAIIIGVCAVLYFVSYSIAHEAV